MLQMTIAQRKELEEKIIDIVKKGRYIPIPEQLKENEFLWRKLLQIDPWYFNIMPMKLQYNKSLALLVITKKNSYENLLKLFDYCPHYLRDEQIVAKLFKVQKASWFRGLISEEIISKPEFVLKYLRYDMHLYTYNIDNAKIVANYDVILEGIKCFGISFYEKIPKYLKSDIVIGFALLQKEPWNFSQLSEELKDIDEFVEYALRYNGELLQDCSKRVRSDPYFVNLAFSNLDNLLAPYSSILDAVWTIEDERLAKEKFLLVYRKLKRKRKFLNEDFLNW